MTTVTRSSVTNTYQSITRLGTPQSYRSFCEEEFSREIPRKYQEVARLAVQITGEKADKRDDLFLLTGIKNILIGS